jgi:hypothetical protein
MGKGLAILARIRLALKLAEEKHSSLLEQNGGKSLIRWPALGIFFKRDN